MPTNRSSRMFTKPGNDRLEIDSQLVRSVINLDNFIMVALTIQCQPLALCQGRKRTLHAKGKECRVLNNRRHRVQCQDRIVQSSINSIYDLSALDAAPEWTLDQIAGLVFGGFLVALYFSSRFIDEYVAVSQRRQLGICEKCGGLNDRDSCAEVDCPQRVN